MLIAYFSNFNDAPNVHVRVSVYSTFWGRKFLFTTDILQVVIFIEVSIENLWWELIIQNKTQENTKK